MPFFSGFEFVRERARTVALASLFALLSLSLPQAADQVVGFSRFCASCGFSGVESFSGQSGQFVVHASPVPLPSRSSTNGPGVIRLEPQLVLVAAERTRRALCRELRLPDFSQDKIHFAVLDRAPAGQPVTVVSQVHPDGFFYKVGLPLQIEQVQFAKGLMQVVLLEFANRGVRRCAELPDWLVEGFTRQAFTSVQPAYVLNRKPMTIETAGYDRLGSTREFFKTSTPLSIQELSFPDFPNFSPEERLRFEASAHLLVHRLLVLPGGPALMNNFLRSLPRTLNWQTALFSVYKDHFNGPLSFEKWWMLNWLEFSKRRQTEHWPLELALSRLDSLLLAPLEVRLATNSIPTHRQTSLQELIQSTGFAAQKDLLSRKVQQMFFLSIKVPAELLPLWSEYQRALDSYLQKRTLQQYQPGLKSDPEVRVQSLIKATINRLDELDRARSELKAAHSPASPPDTNRQASR